MPTYVIVRLSYPGPEDLQHPDLIMQVDGRLPKEFLSHIMEQGYFVVSDDQVNTYSVTARYTIGRYEMTTRLIATMKAWYEEYCCYSGIQNTLLIDCSLPAIGKKMIPAPDAESPLRRIGALKWEQELAVVIEDYEEAEKLKKEINKLTAQLAQEVA